MCDTLVALGHTTSSGHVLFAKNPDREPNEAQAMLYAPAARHRAQDTVRCTYIQVPQAPETRAVVLSKPFWMFGCELGANDRGVVVGNDAVFTRMPVEKTGLLGMDLMRLALNRSDSALEAFRQADLAEASWLERLEAVPPVGLPGKLYQRFWAAQNQAAGIPA